MQDLPPGTYRLRAYHGLGEFKFPFSTPYYETTVDLPARGSKITVKIPYDPPQPDDAPRPAAE